MVKQNKHKEVNMNTDRKRWNGFAASIPGFGHIRSEIPCQDASRVIQSPREGLIVCDGRGSASLSHFGAKGAVRAFAAQCSILEPLLAMILDSDEEKAEQWDKFCQIMYRTLVQVKLDLAEEHHTQEKEFDFTVAFALTGKHHIGCFQVGDGAIVLRQNEECVTAFEPDKGDFANQTHFLRQNGEQTGKYHAALFDSTVNSGIAVTSDGPQFKMFHLAEMKPGEVFAHLFDDLLSGDLERSDILTYLTRNDWNLDPRGSDDRSLALLVPPERPAANVIQTETAEPATAEETVKTPPEPQETGPAFEQKPETAEPSAAAESEQPARIEPPAVPAKENRSQMKRNRPVFHHRKKKRILHSACYSFLTALLMAGGCLYYQQTCYCRMLEKETARLFQQKTEYRKTVCLPQDRIARVNQKKEGEAHEELH
ncbi:MAG: protein phosphatase 2C domain-containing protein [Lentisphaeria bacterium]|nr:protein phosphatase 2C domain-containing protein [Lentisphaeria bacterium]